MSDNELYRILAYTLLLVIKKNENECAVCEAYSQVPKKYVSITVIENWEV